MLINCFGHVLVKKKIQKSIIIKKINKVGNNPVRKEWKHLEMRADKLTIHEGSGRGPTEVQQDAFSCVIQLLLSLWRNPSVTGNRPAGCVFVVSEFIRENRRALCVCVCASLLVQSQFFQLNMLQILLLLLLSSTVSYTSKLMI